MWGPSVVSTHVGNCDCLICDGKIQADISQEERYLREAGMGPDAQEADEAMAKLLGMKVHPAKGSNVEQPRVHAKSQTADLTYVHPPEVWTQELWAKCDSIWTKLGTTEEHLIASVFW